MLVGYTFFLFLPFPRLGSRVTGWSLQAAGYDDIVEILEHAEKDAAGRKTLNEHGMFFNLLEFASP